MLCIETGRSRSAAEWATVVAAWRLSSATGQAIRTMAQVRRSEQGKSLRNSIRTGDQNDLIISLDCCRAEVYLFRNGCKHFERSLPEHRKGDPQ